VISNAFINELNTNLFGSNSQTQINAEYSFSLPTGNSTSVENQNYWGTLIQPLTTNPSSTRETSVETIRNSSPISTSSTSSTISNSNSTTHEEDSFNREEIIEPSNEEDDEYLDPYYDDELEEDDEGKQEEKNESHIISRK
tara:strand:- start:360 stop:782 length:423 start_codon:yes stop_codon:yes gene_type:complete